MKGNINLISYDCYQQATEKQLAGLKWKENRVYYISEIHNEKMQDEIYGYIDDRCRRLSLSTVVNDIYRFDLLKEFLNEKCTSCSSITDKKWEELERSYKAFLYKKGLALYVRRNRPDRRNVEQQSSAQISFLKMYYEYVVKCKTADIPENEKDVWDMRKLDIVPRSNPIRGRYRLDFREIRQKEFKEIIKKILYSHCQTKAMGSIKGELRGFRRFASFMYDRFPEVKHFTEISRDMIEDYLVYIKTDTGLTSVSYTTELSVLDNLLDEIGRELEIGNILIRCQGCDQAVFLMDCSGSSIRMNNIFPCIKAIYCTFQRCITLCCIPCLSILFCNVDLCIYTFVCYIFGRCLSDSKSHIIRLCIDLIPCWNRDFFQINNFLCFLHCEL